MLRLALVALALLVVGCEETSGPPTTALGPRPSADLTSGSGSFSAPASLGGDLVAAGSPVNYSASFGMTFSAISEVDYAFTFGADPLDSGECITFTTEDATVSGFGFCNPGPTAQSSRLLTIPCSGNPGVCNLFLDGSTSGQLIASTFPAGPVSVNVTALTITVVTSSPAPTATFVAAPDLDAAVLTSTVIEGTSIKLALENPAPAGASFEYAFDCGSGYGAFTTKNTAACPTVDNEQRTVRGQIRDADGTTAYTTVVTVVNHNPHVVLSTTQGTSVPLGSSYLVSGSFTDPGVLDAPWAWTILWGDGTSTSGTTTVQGGAITAAHAYAALGTYSIKMTVRDKDGGTGKSNSVGVQVVAAPAGNIWTSAAPMPTPRWYPSAGVVNSTLYVVGGYSSGVLGTVEAYDPVSNSWTTRAPMPTPRRNFGMGVVNGILYAVGGIDQNNTILATVEAYDPATNTWTTRASLPEPRWYLSAGVVNGVLYAVGGIDEHSGMVATVDAYDPTSNSWSTRGPLPAPRYDLAVGVINGVLYAVGGFGQAGPTGGLVGLVAYDPLSDSWTTKAPPTLREGLAAGVVNGLLYAVGGVSQAGVLSTVEAYDPATDAWTARAPLPAPRWGLAAGVVNGILYAVGGLDQNSFTVGTVAAYQP